MTASHPPFPNFKPWDRVAIRMPMEKYNTFSSPHSSWGRVALGAGDMLYVIEQTHFSTLVEEARTGRRMVIETLDLEPWNR